MIIEVISDKSNSHKKNVIYKRYIISEDYKRQFKSVKTRLQSVLLQSVLGWWITKCSNSGLKSLLGVG